MRAATESTESVVAVAERLDSWKEIAAYFGKNVRTVQRWEAESSLPVHRVPGRERGSVYAYVAELDGWLHERHVVEEAAPEVSAKQPRKEVLADSESESAVDDGMQQRPSFATSTPENNRVAPMGAVILGRRWSAALWAAAGVLVLAAGSLWMQGKRPVNPARAAVTETSAIDATTQDFYFRGRYLWNLRTETSLNQAADLFTQAIVHNPHYAPAYAGLADSYLLLRQFGHMSDAEAYARAYAASRQSLALDDSSAEAHRTYAFLLNFWLWNFPAAEAEFRRAIELDPKDAQSHHWYATSLFSEGRYDDALREIDIARELQPDSIAVLANRGLLLRPKDPHMALKYLLDIEDANPQFAPVHRYLAGIDLALGDNDSFLRETRLNAAAFHRTDEVAVVDRAAAQFSKKGERAMLETLAEGYGQLADGTQRLDPMSTAGYYARLKNVDKTIHYLKLACARRESSFLELRLDGAYQFLQGNADFEALLKRSQTPFEAPADSSLRPVQVASR